MKLAATTFTTGPRDDLATADVYEVKDSGVVNNIVGGLADFASATAGKLRNETGIESKISGAMEVFQGRVEDPNEAADRINALMEMADGGIGELSKTLQDSTLDALRETAGDNATMKYLVDGAEYVVRGDKVGASRKLLDTVGRMAGDIDAVQLFDMGAQSALYGELLNEAIRLGMPHLLDKIEEVVTDALVKEQVVRRSLISAVQSGDLPLIQRLVDSLGVGKAMAQYPNLPSLILQYYHYPKTEAPDYRAEYTTLVGLLTQLDPTWDFTPHPQDFSLLAPFASASKDALDLFAERVVDSEYRTEALIAKDYPATEFDKLVETAFPYAVI